MERDLSREARYERITEQLRGLLIATPSLMSAMATVCSLLHAKMRHHSWTGFYLVAGDELHVGPYQGPLACQVLRGGGVCWEAVKMQKSVIVPDVQSFPGHIACDDRARSEVAVPLIRDRAVLGVLDVDSHAPDQFDESDARALERIVALLALPSGLPRIVA
ncbi:MAG: GAF domain-containing protein [Candidatus Bipolaricaulota bacterium]